MSRNYVFFIKMFFAIMKFCRKFGDGNLLKAKFPFVFSRTSDLLRTTFGKRCVFLLIISLRTGLLIKDIFIARPLMYFFFLLRTVVKSHIYFIFIFSISYRLSTLLYLKYVSSFQINSVLINIIRKLYFKNVIDTRK